MDTDTLSGFVGLICSGRSDLEPQRTTKIRSPQTARLPNIASDHDATHNNATHYELGIDARHHRRIVTAFTELPRTI